MKKTRVISAIFLAVFLCLSVSAVYAQDNEYEAGAEIYSVSLNGQGDYLTIEPGGAIELEVWYDFWYPYPLPKDLPEIVIGFEDAPMDCLIAGLLDDITGLTGVFDYNRTYKLVAPTEPGTYHILQTCTKGYTCDGAKKLYREYPSTRKVIGTIEVIEDDAESGAWKCIYDEETEVPAITGGVAGIYRIAIYQRGNEKRIEISTEDWYVISSGSVSISVNEDVYVDYDTGKVSSIVLGETDYTEIIPDPLAVWKEKSALLMAGLIPGIGFALNVIGYVDEVLGDENAVYLYEKKDVTRDQKYPPGDYFNISDMANWRDVVVVPWFSDGKRAKSIRIDCPAMTIENGGTHDIAFRIDILMTGGKVRNDIALPIKFASTWTTDDLPIKKPRQEW